jgi:hypothetical protein
MSKLSTKRIEVGYCSALNRNFPLNHLSPTAAIVVCLLVGGYCCCSTKCDEQVGNARSTPQESPGATTAADALVQQLGAPSSEVRESAAIAFEAMGPTEAKSLPNYIVNSLLKLNGETQRENPQRGLISP